jgi:hypothetical protein
MGNHFRLRLGRHLARKFPQPVHIVGVHALVKGVARGIGWLFGFHDLSSRAVFSAAR